MPYVDKGYSDGFIRLPLRSISRKGSREEAVECSPAAAE